MRSLTRYFTVLPKSVGHARTDARLSVNHRRCVSPDRKIELQIQKRGTLRIQGSMNQSSRVSLKVVSSAAGLGFLIKMSSSRPVFEGSGPIDYSCGFCDLTILTGVNFRKARHLVFHCHCGSYNILPNNDS